MDNAIATILIIDSEGIIHSTNRTIPKRTKEKVLGTSCYDYFSTKERARVKRMVKKVFGSGQSQQGEVAVSLPGSAVTWMDISITPVMDHDRVVSAIFMATDITPL